METINNLALNWWRWMAPMFLQVSLLILIISVIDKIIQKSIWPQIRYGLWLLVLLKLIIPPSFHFSTGIVSNTLPKVKEQIDTKWEKSTFVRTLEIVSAQKSPQKISSEKIATASITKPSENQKIEIKYHQKPVWQTYAMFIHLLGILIFVTLLLIKIKKIGKWHKEQVKKKNIPEWFYQILINTANRLKMNKIPGIVFSNQAVSPAVYGIFNPILLLPDNYIDNLSEEEAEHVLLHELAHIRRGDLYLHGINLGLQIIYWFNPLLIWVTRQTRHVRELCCDITVANYLKEKTSDYRKTLLKTVRELLTESLEPGLALLGVFEEPFRLVSRLKWLDRKIWGKRKSMIISSLLISFVFGFIFLPMAGKNLKESNVQLEKNYTANITAKPIQKITQSDKVQNITKDTVLSINKTLDIIRSYSIKMNRLIMNEQYDSLIKYYAEDVIILPNYSPAIKGIKNIKKEYERNKKNKVDNISSSSVLLSLKQCGNKIYETGMMNMVIKTPNSKPIQEDGKYLTIWEKQEDGSVKVKLAMWNSNKSVFSY